MIAFLIFLFLGPIGLILYFNGRPAKRKPRPVTTYTPEELDALWNKPWN